MVRELNDNDLREMLSQVIASDSLEIHEVDNDGSTAVLIPYMMNDALEYYFRLEEAAVHGDCMAAYDASSQLLLASSDKGRKGLILKNADGDSLRIWYGKACLESHCYQYHRIGHAWRREPGQERIRRLVNLLCVLHDKYVFLGRAACNPLEEKLYRLIEFAPLCYWTPIDDSIMSWYPETEEGIRAMAELAAQAGDEAYLRLIQEYENNKAAPEDTPDEGEEGAVRAEYAPDKREEEAVRAEDAMDEKAEETVRAEYARDEGEEEAVRAEDAMDEKVEETVRAEYAPDEGEEEVVRMARELMAPEHAGIVQLLEEKLREASLYWEPRRYSPQEEETNAKLREQITLDYRKCGYEGEYPAMRRGDDQVLFVEEQPFTVMESEEYQFRIYEIHI